MGKFCRIYSAYYAGLFVVQCGVAIMGLAILATVGGDCVATCPLATSSNASIPDESCESFQGYCLGIDDCKAKKDVQAMTVEDANAAGCFICDGAQVLWPAYLSKGQEKWQPVASCAGGTGGAQTDDYKMCWTKDADASLRPLATPTLWFLTVLYLLQSIGCLVCALGMRHFGHKYSDDWKKLTRRETQLGFAVKLFPKINRYLNIGVFVLLILDIFLLFGVGVCQDVENKFGEKVFFPQVQLYIVINLLSFLFTCAGGTVFRQVQPFDTPRPGSMVKIGQLRNKRKTFKTPRRPFEKERLDQELKLCGEYGLRCKREIYRVQLALAKIRKSARELLTLEESHPRRQLEGAALLRRMTRYGLLAEDEKKLDFVLQLTTQKLLERRLQTQVVKRGLAKSMHHARVLVRGGHIRVGRQTVNVPSFLVRTDSEKHIDFSLTSPFGGGRPGRIARRKASNAPAEE